MLTWLPTSLLALSLLTQAATGTIFGTVTDEAGTPVAGVRVTPDPIDGDAIEPITTGASGAFRFAQVPVGIYVLRFTAAGFRDGQRFGIVVLGGTDRDASISLTRESGGSGAPGASGAAASEVIVRLETPHGAIDIAVDTARAPVTAANFLKYVDGGFYDGGRFHRATRPDNYTPAPPDRPMMEIIQGGINPARAREAFPPIPLERTSVTGWRHVTGVVSMARGNEADTARSDFFILLDDQPSLDFGGRRFADGQGGGAFGRVVRGLDVVRAIQQQPVQGQSLTPPVPISRAYRVK